MSYAIVLLDRYQVYSRQIKNNGMKDNIHGTVSQETADERQIFWIMRASDAIKYIENERVGGNPCFTVQKICEISHFFIFIEIQRIREYSSKEVMVSVGGNNFRNFFVLNPVPDFFSSPKMGVLIYHLDSLFIFERCFQLYFISLTLSTLFDHDHSAVASVPVNGLDSGLDILWRCRGTQIAE